VGWLGQLGHEKFVQQPVQRNQVHLRLAGTAPSGASFGMLDGEKPLAGKLAKAREELGLGRVIPRLLWGMVRRGIFPSVFSHLRSSGRRGLVERNRVGWVRGRSGVGVWSAHLGCNWRRGGKVGNGGESALHLFCQSGPLRKGNPIRVLAPERL
jgi:hypothetical protein